MCKWPFSFFLYVIFSALRCLCFEKCRFQGVWEVANYVYEVFQLLQRHFETKSGKKLFLIQIEFSNQRPPERLFFNGSSQTNLRQWWTTGAPKKQTPNPSPLQHGCQAGHVPGAFQLKRAQVCRTMPVPLLSNQEWHIAQFVGNVVGQFRSRPLRTCHKTAPGRFHG